ncbi:hypothetical protein [Cupriavidus basilensis]|uniref:hypothetical protein n=1 Tax=Cupriavidus basilensis TaxID=68895 RepID=UPI0039F64E3C
MRRGQPLQHDYVAEATAVAKENYAPLLKIEGPLESGTFTWREERYIYVSGLASTGERRLVEVFHLDAGALTPVLAYGYPPPVRDLFPMDYAILHSDDPWNGEFPPATTMASRKRLSGSSYFP